MIVRQCFGSYVERTEMADFADPIRWMPLEGFGHQAERARAYGKQIAGLRRHGAAGSQLALNDPHDTMRVCMIMYRRLLPWVPHDEQL